jgi:hypothetical protein
VFRLVGYGQSGSDFFKQTFECGAVAVFGGVPGPIELVNFREVMGYFGYRGTHFISAIKGLFLLPEPGKKMHITFSRITFKLITLSDNKLLAGRVPVLHIWCWLPYCLRGRKKFRHITSVRNVRAVHKTQA